MASRVVRLAKQLDALDTARAEVLFLIAGSLSSSWDPLFTATRSFDGGWVPYLDKVAEVLKSEEKGVSTRTHAPRVWHLIEGSGLVESSPEEVRSIFSRVGEDIVEKLRKGIDPLLYLEECNARACAAVQELLKKLGVENGGVEVVPLTILLDKEGEGAVAATSCLEREIYWAFDWRPRAPLAAVAAQSVLEHEYLSHLAPRSGLLSPLVREEWLMLLLLFDIRSRKVNQAAYSAVYHLWEHLGALGEVTLPYLWLAAASMDYAHKDLYVRFNREILMLPPDKETAARLDDVIDYLGNGSQDDLRRLFSSPAAGAISGMWEEIQRRKRT